MFNDKLNSEINNRYKESDVPIIKKAVKELETANDKIIETDLADDRTQDWQKELDKGDYFVKDSGYGFAIFGQVLKRHRAKHLENYRLCERYSVACAAMSISQQFIRRFQKMSLTSIKGKTGIYSRKLIFLLTFPKIFIIFHHHTENLLFIYKSVN